MSNNRNLRIFCPIHEASFEVTANAKILCEITGHALSNDFPNAEFWEFCCNCDTFSPSRLGKGEKARSSCFSCQNEISARYVCSNCKTFSFGSSTKSKGQRYFIGDQGIAPTCPGCEIPAQNRKVVRHNCKDVEAEIFTDHETCPFCLETTAVGFVRPQAQTVLGQPQLFASFCHTCSTPVPADSDFCGECGQAVRSSAVPPPPPPPPAAQTKTKVFAPFISPASSDKGNAVATGTTSRSNSTAKILAAVVGSIVLIMVIITAFLPGKKTPDVSGSPTPTAKPYPTATTTTGNETALLKNFDRNYTGIVGGKYLTLTLKRDNDNLTGTATTSKTDKLSGSIESDGSFTLYGYQDGYGYDDRISYKGIWSGRIFSDGSISGKWTTREGTKATNFSANQQ